MSLVNQWVSDADGNIIPPTAIVEFRSILDGSHTFLLIWNGPHTFSDDFERFPYFKKYFQGSW